MIAPNSPLEEKASHPYNLINIQTVIENNNRYANDIFRKKSLDKILFLDNDFRITDPSIFTITDQCRDWIASLAIGYAPIINSIGLGFDAVGPWGHLVELKSSYIDDVNLNSFQKRKMLTQGNKTLERKINARFRLSNGSNLQKIRDTFLVLFSKELLRTVSIFVMPRDCVIKFLDPKRPEKNEKQARIQLNDFIENGYEIPSGVNKYVQTIGYRKYVRELETCVVKQKRTKKWNLLKNN